MVKIGDAVLYVDTVRQERNALVQHVHNQELINIVIVSNDPGREDSYGRQIEHVTSLSRKNENNEAHGFYFVEK
ncbi:MAG: hypothetical protein PHC54_05405 [Candidatus Omnitrophica bacterium]|nr:hypothetical protein [Candidatus Omnitrophota bacterium]MDD5592663.1 hypothetical protein [Candidatus Omnitrophota bacterium]